MSAASPAPETLGGALRWGCAVLAAHSASADLDAEVLLTHVLGCGRTTLRAWPERLLAPEAAERYRALIESRREGWPVAYLTGLREFWSRTFHVAPGVLVPRPETELLIELALAVLPAGQPATLLDLGTGSGIIAITLGLERPDDRIVAIDTSPAALAIARTNAARLRAGNVAFRAGHWLAPLAPDERFDLVVSNPPYIAADDPHLSRGDLRHEPPLALASGPDGLEALRIIVRDAPSHMKPGATLLLEHGYDQATPLAALLVRHGYRDIRTHRDLQGHPRATLARYEGTPSIQAQAMPETAIALPRPLVNQILHLAQLSPECPIAGLVGAKGTSPLSCHPVNATPHGASPWQPGNLASASRSLEAAGENLFAILRSRPDGPPLPTADECAADVLPGVLRLIVGLDTEGVLELRGYRITGPGDWREVALQLQET